MQMGYDFENSVLAAEAGARLRARSGLGDGTAILADPRARDGSGAVSGDLEPAPLRQPDWAGLRARFAAIHALRQALAADSPAMPASGSFAGAGESVLSACRNGTAVNPVYWVNSKGPCAITGSVAAAPHAATED